ncbi:hypothetical protein GQ55_9G619200 [Panicum hallii var. hallii]|uniref:PTBP1-like RNA recognition motif 2 domain-containing protein n=1 Tax=Panicum hallii var. hallii TaxID=1504633 RepID=A0A2T7CHS4_9POAL|nr:hypothetical protein GQ55_9G619200 [Panicum hallii var. hallii]
MATSSWRSPSRALEVTIHQVRYPMTKNVLQQVYVCRSLEHVKARVVSQSKYEAADAYGDLHGRNIHHGCCQLEIKWGLSQEPNVSMVSSNSNTAVSSSSVLFPSLEAAVSSSSKWFPSTTVAMSTIDELCSEKFSVEADATSLLYLLSPTQIVTSMMRGCDHRRGGRS